MTAINGIDQLVIRYLPLDSVVHWDRNPKRHDIGGLYRSIKTYGFRDAPILDAALGQLVAGNGRTHVLRLMRDEGEHPPPGVRVDDEGTWHIPIQMGVDANDPTEAEAFALDHNNLTAAGGDLSATDIARMWEPGYLDLAQELTARDRPPVTITEEDLALIQRMSLPAPPTVKPSADGGTPGAATIKVQVGPDTLATIVAEALRELVSEHPEWRARLVEA